MSQDQQSRAAYDQAIELQLQLLINVLRRHDDGLLIVRLNRDPANPDRTFLSFMQDGIDTSQMIGIINKLMSDINQVFANSQLDPPFPDAKPFVKSIPPNEG